MKLLFRIILWGLLTLMLKDANSQSRTQQENVKPAVASPMEHRAE